MNILPNLNWSEPNLLRQSSMRYGIIDRGAATQELPWQYQPWSSSMAFDFYANRPRFSPTDYCNANDGTSRKRLATPLGGYTPVSAHLSDIVMLTATIAVRAAQIYEWHINGRAQANCPSHEKIKDLFGRRQA